MIRPRSRAKFIGVAIVGEPSLSRSPRVGGRAHLAGGARPAPEMARQGVPFPDLRRSNEAWVGLTDRSG